MKKILLVASFTIIACLVLFNSCNHDADPPVGEDEAMFEEINTVSLYYYQGKDTVLQSAANSPHGNFKLRFNRTALDALGSDGRLDGGSTFPKGALIVKGVVRNGAVAYYAAMKKWPSSPNATGGWLWIEMDIYGNILQNTAQKGGGCMSCHSGNTNRDLVNSFDLH